MAGKYRFTYTFESELHPEDSIEWLHDRLNYVSGAEDGQLDAVDISPKYKIGTIVSTSVPGNLGFVKTKDGWVSLKGCDKGLTDEKVYHSVSDGSRTILFGGVGD